MSGKEKDKQHSDKYTIIVNGRPKKVTNSVISFEDLIVLAFDPVPPNAVFTVTWSHGNQGGSLTLGATIEVQNGRKFDVTPTDQS